jgi:hypothetical protein
MMKNAVESRCIKVVWHFTRIENLSSILSTGIVPRQYLEDSSTDFVYNDDYRIDGQKCASCLSISHPNYKMFYSLRRQNPEQEWVVIGCSPSILWLKECAFCHENAASGNVTPIPIGERKGIKAFQSLFNEVPGKPSRKELRLEDRYPTNPQAEVLVFDTIEPKFILGVVCQKQQRLMQLKETYTNFQFLCRSDPFSYRLDYQYW